MRDKKGCIFVAGIILLGLALRLSAVKFGLPYKWADDAKIFFFSNIMLHKKDPIPDYFMYSSISMYIQAAVMLLVGWVSKLLIALGIASHTLKDIAATFLTEQEMNYQLRTEFAYYSVLWGRAVFGLLNITSGYFVYKIIKRCTGGRFISLLGLALNAFLFIQFKYGIMLRQESLSLFFLAATAYYTIVFYDSPTRLRAILLGISSAVTVTVEYSLAPLLLVPIGVYILAGFRDTKIWSITDVEHKYRIRQKTLLFLTALSIYCVFVISVATTERKVLLYFLSIKYKLGASIIAVTAILSLIAYAAYRLFIKGSKLTSRISQALIRTGLMPYYFIYGFLPALAIFNLGLFIKPYAFGRQVFVYLLGAYTKEFRIYTLTTGQMIRQAASYIWSEQMGPVYTALLLFSFLVFFNKDIDKTKKSSMAIIFSFVSIALSFFILRLRLFHTHRFIAVSSLEISLVIFSLYSLYISVKQKSRVAAYCIVAALAFSGFYPHACKIERIIETARVPENRTLAALWLGGHASLNDTVLIDKALRMDSVDLKRHRINAVFMDVDRGLLSRLHKEKIHPAFIVTTDRKIKEEDFDEIHKRVRQRYVLNHLVYMPLFDEVFKEAYFNLDFLLPEYALQNVIVRKRKVNATESLYELVGRPRISIVSESGSPDIVQNPDILIFGRR